MLLRKSFMSFLRSANKLNLHYYSYCYSSHLTYWYGHAKSARSSGRAEVNHGIPVHLEWNGSGLISRLRKRRVQLPFSVHVASNSTLKKTKFEASHEQTSGSVEITFQLREKLQPLAGLCQVCNLDGFPRRHRIISKGKLVLIILTSLVQSSVGKFGWHVWLLD